MEWIQSPLIKCKKLKYDWVGTYLLNVALDRQIFRVQNVYITFYGQVQVTIPKPTIA